MPDTGKPSARILCSEPLRYSRDGFGRMVFLLFTDRMN